MRKDLWLALGWLAFTIGAIGAFVPLLPTTPFLILAAACFSKGSPRIYQWLINHPGFGPPIKDWEEDGVIRLPAKILATVMIVFSFSMLTFFTKAPMIGKVILDSIAVSVLIFIWSRPSDKVGNKE